MVRRGSRAVGPLSNNTSSSSGSNENQWKSTRTQSSSADTSLAKSAKSCDSANSSPSSGNSISPIVGKKGTGKTARSSSHWRTRGGGGNGRNTVIDSKFTITSEDFPALPGARGEKGGTAQSTPSKYVKKEKENGKHFNSDLQTTDDSGVSSTSRGHTPTDLVERAPHRESNSSLKPEKPFYEKKKAGSAAPMASEHNKRKNNSPVKERPPRVNVKHGRIAVQSGAGNNSTPKKKTINANAANTAPSFMKLSKVGQKIPERRGGQRINNQSPLSASSGSPTSDDKENKPKKETHLVNSINQELNVDTKKPKNEESTGSGDLTNLFQKKPYENSGFSSGLPNSHCIFHPSDVPNIILGKGGEMSNIPPTMLSDQFGLAALLPILDIVRNRSVQVDMESLNEEQLREKIENENIEMITIGFDLNELGVPMKTHDPSQKPVWETFAGPFGSQPLLPTNMGLSHNQVPSVYYTARTLQSSFDMLTNIPEKFGLHELFYIFYNFPKEVWQLNAARELQYRGWRFNMKERLWVLKMLPKQNETDSYNASISAPQNPFTQPGPNQEDLMVGNFEIYDVEKARICSAQMSLRRSDFEVPAWEQKQPDNYQRMVSAFFPKDVLWGPREDRKNFGLIQGISGVLPNFNGRNKLANLTIPKPQQPSERRLLSFADSPDVSSNYENPFGTLPPATAAEEICRQQMYAMILQKMQMHQQQQQQQFHQQQQQQQHQQHVGAPNQSRATSSFSASNYF